MSEHFIGYCWKFEDEPDKNWRLIKYLPKWYIPERDTDIIMKKVYYKLNDDNSTVG